MLPMTRRELLPSQHLYPPFPLLVLLRQPGWQSAPTPLGLEGPSAPHRPAAGCKSHHALGVSQGWEVAPCARHFPGPGPPLLFPLAPPAALPTRLAVPLGCALLESCPRSVRVPTIGGLLVAPLRHSWWVTPAGVGAWTSATPWGFGPFPGTVAVP